MPATHLAKASCAVLILLLAWGAGCSTYRETVSATCIRPSFFDSPRGNRAPINFIHLRQEPPANYLLGPRDVLGVYIEGVLGANDNVPPVRLPDSPDTPPAIGFPIPVEEDGAISLPLLPPLKVENLTLAETNRLIRKAYFEDLQILRADRTRVIVTLMKQRTYSVLVIREDAAAGPTFSAGRPSVGFEPPRQAATKVVQLRAYENDVLHALVESGGLPGLDAKNEITILRGGLPAGALTQPMTVPTLSEQQAQGPTSNAVKIPLRVGPDDPPVVFAPHDIVLKAGDVLFIESRRAEVFYTGGLLHGGQFPLPRDYDIDVLGAIAMSGGSIGAAAGGTATSANGTFRGNGVGTLFPPTRVIVIRNINGQMVVIKLSLKTAMTSPQERILVQPNDMILLEYTESELCMNMLLNNLNLNLSLNQLFQR